MAGTGNGEVPVEIERKFLLAAAPDWSHPVLAAGRETHFEQVYLIVSDAHEERVRRRAEDDKVIYEHALLDRLDVGKRNIVETYIGSGEYEEFKSRRDPLREIVVKRRTTFPWEGTVFELDAIYRPVSRACHILEVQIDHEGQEFALPDFLEIDREVTGDSAYANADIALG